MTTILVVGGARSGKSTYAEALLRDRERVTYVAPGHALTDGDDADTDWIARIAAHRARRPGTWATREGPDLPALVRETGADEALLVDCLGTWLTRLLDDAEAWDDPPRAQAVAMTARKELAAALCVCRADVILVSNEVGLGVVPMSASGRLFRDELGRLNAALAEVTDRAVFVVAGRVLDLTHLPRAADPPPLSSAPPPRREITPSRHRA